MHDIDAASIVRHVRERAALSQQTLAGRAGTTQAAIARIESGQTKPSVNTLKRIVSAAGFELRLTVVEHPVSDPVVEAYKPGVDQTMLIENLKKTPRERIENLMAMQRFAEHVAIAGRDARKKVAARGPGYRAN